MGASSKVIVVNNKSVYDTIQEEFIVGDNILSVYPNAASNMVIIEIGSTNLKKANVLIKNISGKTVLTKLDVGSEKSEIDISDLQNGIYFIELISSGELITTKKLIKQ